MRKHETSFFQYVRCQNQPQYKLTGVISGRDGMLYTERHYAGFKCAIDFVMLITCATLWLLGSKILMMLLALLYTPHTGAYDPNIGWKAGLRGLITGVSAYAFFFFFVPACMKIIRMLFSFRWLFVKFDKADGLEDAKKQAAVKYFEYYNNVTSFQCDRLGYFGNKKIKEIQDEYYQVRNIEVHNKWIITFYQFLIIALFACMMFALINEGVLLKVLIYGGLVLIYGLSHVFTYLGWKKGVKRVAQAS